MSDKYQTVTLLLSDGRSVTYTGRLQIDPDNLPTVTEVSISRGIDLPSGMYWSGLPENLRQPQTPTTGIGAIIGKWPGNETDEEINEALERLS